MSIRAKRQDRTEWPVICSNVDKTSDERLSRFFCHRQIVYSWRRSTVTDGGVRTTPQMTRFRDVQHAIIMATVWVYDDRTKSNYDIKKKTWNYVCVVKPNNETPDTDDDVKTKTNTKHMKRDTCQVNVHVVFLIVRVVVILTHCTPHRVA